MEFERFAEIDRAWVALCAPLTGPATIVDAVLAVDFLGGRKTGEPQRRLQQGLA
jgi:hypothetical protein